MGGGHRPFSTFKVRCVAKDGHIVAFRSSEVDFDATFQAQEDADYFQVETEYIVSFMPSTGGDLAGAPDAESKSSG